MSIKISFKQSFSLIGGAISTLVNNPQVLRPFAFLAFIQMLLMEILFFATRPPLVNFFKPIIVRLKGEVYLHYPFNYDLMNHWFQSLQVWVFLLITSMVVGKLVMMVAQVNVEGSLKGNDIKLGLRKYINLVVAFLLVFLFIYGMTSMYNRFLIQRAAQIRSTTGIYFMIKQAVLIGAPYFSMLFSVIAMMLLAYLPPIIVLGNKNIFTGLVENFKILWATFIPLFVVIFTTTLFFVPILLIKSNYQWFSEFMTPETWQIFVIFGVFVLLAIDAVQYTAITTCYLLTKDE